LPAPCDSADGLRQLPRPTIVWHPGSLKTMSAVTLGFVTD
jgi:hypothetical protein